MHTLSPNPNTVAASSPAKENAPKRHTGAYLIAVVVIIALVGVVFYATSKNAIPPTTIITPSTILPNASTTLSTTTIKPANASTPIESFYALASTLTLPTNLQDVGFTRWSGTYCHTPVQGALTFYSPAGLGYASQQINYSTLNQSEPFVEYISTYMVNDSALANFTAEFNNGSGYCRDVISPMLTNNSYAISQASFDGIPGHIWRFYNFTDAGLVQSQINYTPGSKPNLEWYVASVLYKNYNIRVSMWVFAGHMNETKLINNTDAIVAAFKSKYG